MKNPFKRKKELKAEVIEVTQEQKKLKEKTARIDKLSKDLRNHLHENNLGERLYEQMVQAWR